jgi:hypothetical protein
MKTQHFENETLAQIAQKPLKERTIDEEYRYNRLEF